MALFDELRSFLAEVETQQVKAASSKKRAASNTEAGSYSGGTSHPVKSVDDQTEDANEGERSTENSADVREQVPGGGVDAAPENAPDQEGQQFDVGITSHETGEDPAHEGDYKDTKEDPGTSHPAKTEDGEKYSSMSFAKLKTLTEKKANALIAGIAVTIKEAEHRGKPQAYSPSHSAKVAAAVGYDQAVSAGSSNVEYAAFFKEASENMLRDALSAATATGQYLSAFNKQLAIKLAAEEAAEEGSEPASHEESEPVAQEAGEEAGGSGGAGGSGMDEADMAAMAGASAGGAPGGPGGGDQGSIDELLAALAEMGVTPDEVMAALSEGQGGGAPGGDMAGMPPEAMMGGGGMPPEAMMGGGGMPPEAMMGGAPKMAAASRQTFGLMKAAKARARSGKFQISAAKTAGQRQLRNEIKKCISEIVG